MRKHKQKVEKQHWASQNYPNTPGEAAIDEDDGSCLIYWIEMLEVLIGFPAYSRYIQHRLGLLPWLVTAVDLS